jgi:tetratricopeptide (TPR) repeat protein
LKLLASRGIFATMRPALALLPLVCLAAQDVETAYKNLKEAESKKDAALVRKWAAETSAAARKAAAEPEPANPSEKESWTNRVNYARQVDVYTEYSLYATALQAEPGAVIELTDALEKQNAKSQYLTKIGSVYLVAVAKTAPNNLMTAAEKVAATDPANEDALLILADGYLTAKQTDKALAASDKLIGALGSKQKPEGSSEADWTKKKTATLTRAHWIAGVIQGENGKYEEADRHLRTALPEIQDKSMLASAYFYLGVANYKLGQAAADKARLNEAAKFSDQCAAIPGPYQAPAQRNAKAIRSELATSRTPARKK